MDAQYIVALDKNTGKTIWRIDRDEKLYSTLPPMERKAYVTPIVINVADRDLLISNGSAGCFAYELENGEEVWRIVQGLTSTVSMPAYWNGNVFFYGGLVNKEDDKKHCHLMAVNPDGKGDITKTNIFWEQDYSIPQMLTPVVNKGVLYTMDTRGNMQGIDALTGKIYWTKRFNGKFNSSPICAGGFVYFNSNRGETVVIKEGKELNIVSENRVKGQIWATPAFVNGSILLRTSEYLYKVGL
jgi:outer membrane protein assembly factor BamB